MSSEVEDTGKYYCVVLNGRQEDVEISYEALVTVMSDDEYYDYHDANTDEEANEKVDEEIESATKIEDAISRKSVTDDGKIFMEIEATAIENHTEELDDVTKNDIPLVFWIICLSVVSFMTLLVIFGAGFIIFKIKNMKHLNVDCETGANIYEKPSTKRMSWIETPWNFYPTSTQLKTFRNQNLLNTSENTSNHSSDYDYASSDYFLLSKIQPESVAAPSYMYKSNHYASSGINK